MPTLKTYDLFISHAWSYHDDYYRIIDLLNRANYFSYRNYSVPKHDPIIDLKTQVEIAQLKAALDKQIKPVNCVLILSGMYVNHKYWIQTEIEIAAQKYRKPIIGVIPQGAERIPLEVTRVAKEMVRWNTDSVVNAIRKYSI